MLCLLLTKKNEPESGCQLVFIKLTEPQFELLLLLGEWIVSPYLIFVKTIRYLSYLSSDICHKLLLV